MATRSTAPSSSRGCRLAAAIAVITGLLLPPAMIAARLRPDDFAELIQGFWLLKAALVAIGVALLGLDRWGRDAPANSIAPLTQSERLLLVVILVVALVLRLRGLGSGLWYDEIQTLVEYVRSPFFRMMTTFDSTNQHPLYSVLASVSVSVMGETPEALRLPATLLGVASLLGLVAFGRRIGMVREALLTAGFMAVSYHHIWFSQNARGYTGLMLGTVLSSALLLDLLRGRGTRARVLGYAVVTALAVYTHLTALFTVAAHGFLWLAAWRATNDRARWDTGAGLVLAALVAFALYAPILPQVLTALTTPSREPVTTPWKEPVWMLREAFQGLVGGLPGGAVTLVGGVTIGIAGFAALWRRDRVATGMMVLPVAVTALALLVARHNLWPRFFFFASGFAGLMAVGGGFSLLGRLIGPRAVPVGSAVIGVAMVGSLLTMPRAWRPKQDFLGAAQFVESKATAGDAIAVSDLTETPYLRWLAKPWTKVATSTDLSRLEAAHPTTWVLTTFAARHAAVHPELADRLRLGYDTAAVFPGTLGGGSVIVFRSRAGQR